MLLSISFHRERQLQQSLKKNTIRKFIKINMSSVNIHDVFVPMYIRALQNTAYILTKGAAYTKANGIPEPEVLNWRLAPDMNPLIFQVQNICNIAKNLIVVVAGTSLPTSANNETSFAELQARITSTIELLQKTTREQFEGRDQANVTVRELGYRMKGIEYVQEFGVPNFYFHNSMVYALFRGHGAPIGKWDYLRGGN
jgi:uncharacterized protein